jgi:hypothetical protein
MNVSATRRNSRSVASSAMFCILHGLCGSLQNTGIRRE